MLIGVFGVDALSSLPYSYNLEVGECELIAVVAAFADPHSLTASAGLALKLSL